MDSLRTLVSPLHALHPSLYRYLQPVLNPETSPDQITPDQITQWFCLGIVACCLALLWTRNCRKFSQSITTVVGILGTFVGIYIGLFDFDSNDIEKSVPPLLAGLKTAFLTSIFGIVATLFTRIIDRAAIPLWRRIFLRRRAVEEGATVSELLRRQTEALHAQTEAGKESHKEALAAVQALESLLRAQAEADKTNHGQTLESLESIRASVSGEGEASMLTQVQKFRTAFADKQDELIGEFRAFAEKMAEANSQALIKALEEVIRDFNAKINEQFGDNFRQLNQAVEKLVVWQDKYAEQTQAMIAQFERTVSATEQTRDAIAEIAQHSWAITESAEKLAPVLSAIEEQRKSLADYMKQFADVSEKAKELLPTLEAKVGELTEGFASAVRRSMEENQKTLDEQRKFIETVIAGFSKLDETATAAIQQVSKSSEQNIERMRKYMEDAEEQQKKIFSDVAARLRTHIEEAFTSAEQAILQMSENLSEAVQRSMEANQKNLDEQRAKVGELTEGFASAVRRSMEENQKTLDEQRAFIEKVIAGFSKLDETATAAMEQVSKSSKQSIEHMRAYMEDAEEQQKTIVSDVAARLNTHVEEAFTSAKESTDARMNAINKGLEDALKETLSQLGRRMASISEQFASDYTPLAAALKRVMDILRKANGDA